MLPDQHDARVGEGRRGQGPLRSSWHVGLQGLRPWQRSPAACAVPLCGIVWALAMPSGPSRAHIMLVVRADVFALASCSHRISGRTYVEMLEAVTQDDIRRFVQRLLGSKPSLATFGDNTQVRVDAQYTFSFPAKPRPRTAGWAWPSEILIPSPYCKSPQLQKLHSPTAGPQVLASLPRALSRPHAVPGPGPPHAGAGPQRAHAAVRVMCGAVRHAGGGGCVRQQRQTGRSVGTPRSG